MLIDIEFYVVGRATSGGEIGEAVLVDVTDSNTLDGDRLIYHRAIPLLGFGIVVVEVECVSFPPVTCDDFIITVTVKIRATDGVSAFVSIVDHFTPQWELSILRLCVYSYLMPMPGIDCREKSGSIPECACRDFAAAGLAFGGGRAFAKPPVYWFRPASSNDRDSFLTGQKEAVDIVVDRRLNPHAMQDVKCIV